MERWLLPLTALVLAAVAVGGLHASGASYVHATTGDVDVAAAHDWTPPTVAVTPPGDVVSGTATVSATARDERSAVASVTIEYAGDDSAWRTLCTDTVAPYSCAWPTTSGEHAVPDGAYELRARALDTVGLDAVSTPVTTRVANTARVVLSPLPDAFSGNVALTATYTQLLLPARIHFEYSAAGTGDWKSVAGCGPDLLNLANPRTCTWSTTALPDGDYDVRAVARVGTGLLITHHDVRGNVLVDNTAPEVSLSVPPNPLTGVIALTAAADDADSGVSSITFQHRRHGTTSWQVCGTDTEAPWRCSLDTTTLTDGTWEFRAIARDAAGNSTTTAVQARTVNNTISSVSITAPVSGDTLRGQVLVTAAASSTAGVSGVAVQTRASGGAWSTICTDTSAPYSCRWDTTTVLGGSHELRALLTDGTGALTTSATVPVTVDNSTLRAQDVQVTDVAVAGRPAAGDRITLTWSTVVDPATIQAGWTGAPTSLGVVVNDKGVSGAPLAGNDWVDLTGSNLGRLSLAQNYVGPRKSATFAATMTADTRTVGGVPVTVVEITLGGTAQTSSLRVSNATGTLRWYPTTLVRTPTGMAASAGVAAESGTSDKDF